MTATVHENEIERQFTLQAVTFGQVQAHSAQESFDFIREMARVRESDSVLDAGCGPGLVCGFLAAYCRQVTGVDVTRAMIDEAAKRAIAQGLRNIRFVESSIDQMPFRDGEFDATVSRYVFHHLENPFKAFAEMLRATRSGGRIVICDAAPAAACRDHYDIFEKKRDASHSGALTLEELVGLGEYFSLGEAAVRRFGLPMELNTLLDSSFPNGSREELRQMIASDLETNRHGLKPSIENGELFIRFPISVVGWTKS